MCFSLGTAEILMTDLPKLPFRSLKPPDSLKGLVSFSHYRFIYTF